MVVAADYIIARMHGPYSLDASVAAAPAQLSTTLGDDVVILGLRDTVYYGLSGAGTRIWQSLQTGCRVGEIVASIVAEFDVTREQAAADLQALLADLETRGLVTIDDSHGS
jgi:Coenzyme PQQ synthesis protein D (PqqD)